MEDDNKPPEIRNTRSIPNPDPTLLTTQQLIREISMLRELLEVRINCIEHLVELNKSNVEKVPGLIQTTISTLERVYLERFNAIDLRFAEHQRANEAVDAAAKHATDTAFVAAKSAVAEMRMFYEERFRTIDGRFSDLDKGTERTARDSKVAVDAAFAAAKEAVGEQNKSNTLAISKSEASVSKQIDQLNISLATMNAALIDKIDDVKNRLNIIEQTSKSGEGHTKGIGDMWGWIIGFIGVFATIVTLVVMAMGKNSG